MAAFVEAFLIFLGLLLTYSMFRHSRLLTLTVFILVPLIFLPIWIIGYHFNWFFWAKMFSVTFFIGLLFFCGNTQLRQKQWIYSLIWAVFAFNIAEAILYDLLANHSMQYINAITGLVLIITLPGPSQMKIDMTSPQHDFSWNMSYHWIITYTLWNWVFVYGNWPSIGSLYHIAVLAASLFIALFDRTRWAQARAFTLGTYFIIWFFFKPFFDQIPEGSSWYNPNIYLGIAFVVLCVALSLFVKSFDFKGTTRRFQTIRLRINDK